MDNCIACGHESFRFKTANGYSLRKCVECLLEFCWPMPDEDALRHLYTGYLDPLAHYSVSMKNALRNIAALGIKGRVLDYGAGRGAFGAALAGVEEVISYDPYRSAGLIPAGPFDWITMWGVLEHLTDPADTLRTLHKILGPDGRLALTTVSIETPIPYRHKPPEHTLYFTRSAIEALADVAHFKVIEYRPYRMMQDCDIYLETLLRTMPDDYRGQVHHSLPQYVEIPTNEVFVVCQRR